jgi:hypothetical protein
MVLCDAEKTYTGQQDRYLFTALGAGGPRFKSARPDQSFHTLTRFHVLVLLVTVVVFVGTL